MDKNILEAKIKNGKWVKQPQDPKSTSAKTQIIFLIFEGDYSNTGAKTTAINPKNVNLASWPLSKVKMVPSH